MIFLKTISDAELVKNARRIAKIHKAPYGIKFGEVGCALVSGKNNVFVGASIDTNCDVCCAERSAIAAMVTKQEYLIKKIVAVSSDGKILPPCGRCCEFMYEINPKNFEALVIVDKNKAVKLKDLLPFPWQKKFPSY